MPVIDWPLEGNIPDAVVDGDIPVDPRRDVVELLTGKGGKDDRLIEGNGPVPGNETDPVVGPPIVFDELVEVVGDKLPDAGTLEIGMVLAPVD